MTKTCSCEACASIFQLRYQEEDVEDSPGYCPFCGEKIYLDDEIVFEKEKMDEIDDELDV